MIYNGRSKQRGADITSLYTIYMYGTRWGCSWSKRHQSADRTADPRNVTSPAPRHGCVFRPLYKYQSHHLALPWPCARSCLSLYHRIVPTQVVGPEKGRLVELQRKLGRRRQIRVAAALHCSLAATRSRSIRQIRVAVALHCSRSATQH